MENLFTTLKPFNNLLTLGITLSCTTDIWEGPREIQRPLSHSPYPPGAHSSERREENRSSYSRGQWNHRWAGGKRQAPLEMKGEMEDGFLELIFKLDLEEPMLLRRKDMRRAEKYCMTDNINV